MGYKRHPIWDELSKYIKDGAKNSSTYKKDIKKEVKEGEKH